MSQFDTARRRLRMGTYHRRSMKVRQAARTDPTTKCWRCGRTYAEAVRLWGQKGAAWQAGHVIDSNPRSPLAPEHARCNTAAGGKLRWQRRRKASPNA